MDYRTLKQTDLKVSRLCLGTMTFGAQTDAGAAAEMVNLCLERGVNFFDTANVYNRGESEAILGQALGDRRQGVILASKVRGKMGDGPDESGLSRAAIVRAVEESLRRLQTDYLDLYYLHQPDYDVPLDETLAAADALVRSGKVRYVASSNYASWQVCRMLWLAERNGWRPVGVAQQMYNLLARGLEQEFLPMAAELGVSTVAYNPLAGGLLTGKHRREEIAAGTRFDGNAMYQDRYWHGENFDAVAELRSIAAEAGRQLVGLALCWLLHHTPTDAVILGASRLGQLAENLAACEGGPLPAEAISRCDEVWRRLRGPVPKYNR
jgi:1-deoxyxylulose-5-phosphate synthase